MILTIERWAEILIAAQVKPAIAARWAGPFALSVQPDRFNMGLQEMDDFVAHALHETRHLESIVEDLNYSARRMTEVWPGRFPTEESARPFAHNPYALAEKTYGGRMGNSRAGDGFKYRGRGIPHITGRDNYALVERLTGEPLVEFPHLLEDPALALRVGIAWWENKVPDSAIDTIERSTRIVQGGQLGLRERREAHATLHAVMNGPVAAT